MVANLFKIVVFVLLCFLMVEQSYRVYSVGAAAFSYTKMNSLTSILDSGLVELSDNPEIYYQLKPNLNRYYKSVPFQTNSHGLADKEYALKKEPGTLRVAVIGSSWSMASGVKVDESYHALLEEKFSSDPDTPKVEFINFSVEYYSLREIVAIVKERVPAWQPDLIIIPVTFTTASIVFEAITRNRELPPRMYPFFTSFTLQELNKVGVRWPPWSDSRNIYRTPISDYGMGVFRMQLERSMREVDKAAREIGAESMLLWLGFEPPRRRVLDMLQKVSDDTEMYFVTGSSMFLESKAEQEKLRISRFDRHPNQAAHKLIAADVERAILEKDLLFGQ